MTTSLWARWTGARTGEVLRERGFARREGCRAEARRYILRRAAGRGLPLPCGGIGHIARMPFPGSYLWANSAVYQAMDGRSSYP